MPANYSARELAQLSRRVREDIIVTPGRLNSSDPSARGLVDILANVLHLISNVTSDAHESRQPIPDQWVEATASVVFSLQEFLASEAKFDPRVIADAVDKLLRRLNSIDLDRKFESDLYLFREMFQEWEHGNRSEADERARFSRLEASMTERIGAQLARNDALIAERLGRLADIENNLAARVDEITGRFSDQLSEHVSDGERRIADLNDLRDDAKRLLVEVADRGTTTDYLNYANQERKSGRLWRAGAVMGGSITVAILVGGLIWFPIDKGTPWQVIVSRFAVATVIAGLAAYAARESRRHFDAFGRAKGMQLDLVAIGPFIANLPDEDQRAVRIELAHRLFGPQQIATERVTDALGPTSGAVIAAIAEKVWQQLPGNAKPPGA